MLKLIGVSWFIFLLASLEVFFCKNYPTEEISKKFIVKENSIIRKTFRIQTENEGSIPLDYFRAVPMFVSFIIAIILSLIGLLDVVFDGKIANFLSESALLIISYVLIIIYVIYFFSIIIWWGVARKLEYKSKKEIKTNEVYELEREVERLRKEEKRTKKGKKKR